jgi:hypothetical protein
MIRSEDHDSTGVLVTFTLGLLLVIEVGGLAMDIG